MSRFIISAFWAMFLYALPVKADLCTAIVNGGDWSSPATWSCGTVPGNNDTMWIPAGFTVNMDINSPEYTGMQVINDGTLNFENGMKLNICGGSSIYVSTTGQLSGGTPGSKINLCGTTVWNGPGPTNGVLYFGDVVLPVELISFSGNLTSQGQVELQWKTASEKNNSHFTIERSSNGLTFTEIGRVNGHGTVSMEISYSFTDPSPGSGTNYYRLKQTDYNGRTESIGLIAVEVLKNDAGCILSVFPNPCQGFCTVNFSDCPEDNTGSINLEVIDANGTVVTQQVPARDANGSFTTSIDASNNLKPGVYIVRGTSSKAVYSQRAVIK